MKILREKLTRPPCALSRLWAAAANSGADGGVSNSAAAWLKCSRALGARLASQSRFMAPAFHNGAEIVSDGRRRFPRDRRGCAARLAGRPPRDRPERRYRGPRRAVEAPSAHA